MRKSLFFLIALLMLALLATGTALAWDDYYKTDIGNFYFDVLEDGTAQITKLSMDDSFLKSEVKELVIPEEVTGKFNGGSYRVSSVCHSIEDGFESYTSRDKNVENVETLVIPDSVDVIGNPVMSFRSLKTIQVSDTHPTLAFFNNALFNKKTKTLLAVPRGLEYSYTVPDGIVEIGDYAFFGCNLTRVDLPDSVAVIGLNPFCSSKVTDVIVNGSHPTLSFSNSVLFDKTSGLLISGFKKGNGEINVPEGISVIGKHAFFDLDIKAVTLPSTVKEIGDYAFYSCNYLESVNIPEGVEKIGEKAFYECTAIQEWNLPDTVMEIGTSAFHLNSGITSFRVPSGITVLKKGILGYCSELKEVILPAGLTEIEYGAFAGTDSLESVTFPDGLKTIGEQAFLSSGLRSVVLPDSVEKMDRDAFRKCKYLEEIRLSNSLKTIKISMFMECPALCRVILPESLESIGTKVFYNCPSLKEIYIPFTVGFICNGVNLSFDDTTTLIVEQGSYAEDWCINNRHSYILAQDYEGDLPVPQREPVEKPAWLRPSDCTNCGYHFPEGNDFNFCPYCGQKIE